MDEKNDDSNGEMFDLDLLLFVVIMMAISQRFQYLVVVVDVFKN